MKIRILNRRKPSFVHVFLFLFMILLIMFVIHLKENKPITRGFLQTPGCRILRTSLLKQEIIYEDIKSADTQMEELKDDKTNAIMDNVAESYHGDIMAESEEIIDETEEFDADVRQTGVDFVTEIENYDVMQMNAVTNKTVGDETLMEPQTAKSALNIFIIEEHHEALPYWFEAADNGILPKTDNTLIHIDGHSDMAPPFIIPGFPLFKWPRKDQVRLLMQRNDAFIQSAIMAGLISRVVWVWPQWDHGNHETHHESFMVKIGWTLANTTNSSDPQIFHCACQESYGQQECSYYNFEQEEVQIEPQRCKIRRKFLMEMVNEMSAFQVLKEKDWILDNENIILDIDEDFYGCSYVIKPLLDANVTMETVKAIDNSIKEIVCPITTVHETYTNRILLKTVALIRLQKLCHKENLANCSKSGINLKADLILYKLLIHAFDNNETYFCQKPGKQVDLQTFVGEFIKLISELTVQQLMVIEEIGFCSTTTPKALPLYQPVEFGLCYGANTPAISVITEFTPTSDDILRRSLILKLILKNLKKNRPKIVSICRSVRDGYTPRKFFSQIENDILSALNKTFEVTNIHYDLDLLGGKEGRPGGSRKFGTS